MGTSARHARSIGIARNYPPNRVNTPTIEKQVDLSTFTTFGVHAIANRLISCTTIEQLASPLSSTPNARVLGGGSNILITHSSFDDVIHVRIKGIEVVAETATHVHVRVGAGEAWHDFVTWCVMHDYGGLENLALIPGTVGAAPIQNIGAYGVEQQSCCVEVCVVDRERGSQRTFTGRACEFAYRSSIFKTSQAGKYAIASVTYQLSKPPHIVHHAYKDVQHALAGIEHPTIAHVYHAVVAIRTNKLPDPSVVGNAGSFFKNPVVTMEHYQRVLRSYSTMPCYPVDQLHVKVPAAWLIDNAGWKGYQKGAVGVHQKQALVLINLGGAAGSDVLLLANQIADSVFEKYGIQLEMEVNVW